MPSDLLKYDFTLAVVLITLSLAVSTITRTPWGPFPSNVTSLKSFSSLSLALLIVVMEQELETKSRIFFFVKKLFIGKEIRIGWLRY